MALSTVRSHSVFAFLGRHEVVLASPYPAAECCGRLETATRRHPFGSFSRLPLQGRVRPDLIRVARRPPSNGRNGMMAWFIGRIEQAPDGRTLIAGTIGPHPTAPVVIAWLSVVWLLVGGGLFAGGVSSLVSGHPVLPELLIPLVFAAAYVFMLVSGPRMARKEIEQLLDELNTILDSTATFPATRA